MACCKFVLGIISELEQDLSLLRLVVIIHYNLQDRSQTQNLGGGGGANIFWENKISEVDFIHFYENLWVVPSIKLALNTKCLIICRSFWTSLNTNT